MNWHSLASHSYRAWLGACVLTALCSLAPTFGQSLPSVNLPGLLGALLHAPPATGPFAYNSFVPALRAVSTSRRAMLNTSRPSPPWVS